MRDPFDDDVADNYENKDISNDKDNVNSSNTTTQDVSIDKKDISAKPNLESESNTSKLFASDFDIDTLLHDIYKDTKIDFSLDDPIIVSLLANHKFLIDAKIEFEKSLNASKLDLNNSINATLTNGLKIFDERFSAMQKILNDLENQKDHLIAEIYAKSKINIQESIAKQFRNEIIELVKQSSNQNNQIKNYLFGGIVGALFGIAFSIVFIFLLK